METLRLKNAIQVESLGKRYRIGQRQQYLTLRDQLRNVLDAPMRMLHGAVNGRSNRKPNEIWALRNVSFTVGKGEVIGLIGRNGSGKTTLLKILSRVTQPTEGSAEIRGRVGSLLEVGTGFHPELTGRENTYLNGAILGMGKKEIERKFDDIVAFAEVADFIDTPLKHFSTGMQMRLAFAVAAHFEPQILLVDEVLAVGDLAFQKKCLGKMDEVAQGGRTILFVSHQMSQIRRLCPRVIWIDHSRIRADGPAGEVISAYEATQMEAVNESGAHCFLRWEIAGQGHTIRDGLREVTFQVHVNLKEAVTQGHFGFGIMNESNLIIVGWGFDDLNLPAGVHKLSVKLPLLPLRPGAYMVSCSLFNRGNNLTGGQSVDHWYATPPLVVDTAPLAHPQDRWAGVLNIPADLQASDATWADRRLLVEE
jgi:ABC-type polysaccharide/polyol phosphate transport system ATPase subunit